MESAQAVRQPTPKSFAYLGALLIAVGVCLLAWIIMVHHLDLDSMWWDEHFTWRISREGPAHLIRETGIDIHPPTHYLWVWIWREWMGGNDTLFVNRMSSVITSMLTAAVTYRLGTDWFRSRWVGLGAALFIATSGLFIFYARELRMYSLITLFAALSWWMLARLTRGRRGSLWGYAAAVALMAYTFYTAAFIVVTQFIVVLIFYRRHFGRMLLACVIAFVTFLPWLPTVVHQITVTKSQRMVEDDVLIVGPLATQPTGANSISMFVEVYTAYSPAFILLLAVLAVVSGLSSTQPVHLKRWLIITAMWFLLTSVMIFLVNLAVPVYGLRYTITILPALAILVAAAVRHVRGFWPRAAILAVILLTGLLGHDRVFDELTIKPPHRDLMQIVARNFQPGDRIWYNLNLGARGSSLELSADYHLKYDAPELNSDDFVWNAPRDYIDITRTPRVWDVRPYWIPMPEDAQAVLVDGRFVTEEYHVREYRVLLYEAPPADRPATHFGELFEVMSSTASAATYLPGEDVPVKTWWRALQPPLVDYSYGLYLRDSSGVVIAEANDGLVFDDNPTSQWQPSDQYVPVILTLNLPDDLAVGRYDLLLGTYFWENPERLPVSGEAQQAIETELNMLRVADIQVQR